MTPRAVIFDVGRVLIEWDVHALFAPLLGDAAAVEAFLAETEFGAWNLSLDRGRPLAEGVAEMAARFPHRAGLFEAFAERWIETVPGPIEGSVALLEALRAKGVPLYAITNFSAETWPRAVGRFPFLGTAFRDVVVSGEVGLLKPDPAIYELCLARNGLEAAACLFIDDSPANVAGARTVGIPAIPFTGPHALRAALAHAGLLP